MKKTLIIIIPTILVFFVAFSLFNIKSQIKSDIKYINGLLYHLNIEMDILEYSKKHYNEDRYLEGKLLHLIINKLIILSNLNPPIEQLDGIPLIALNRLIQFNKYSPVDFKLGDNDYFSQTISSYLDKIEDDIEIEVKKREIIFKDPLKKEIKEKWKL